MVSNCNAFYFVKSSDKCQSIADAYGLTLAQFTSWNTGVGGAACTGLWANTYVCVNIIGRTPTTKPTTTTAAAPSACKTSHPDPTQPGSICACRKWYLPGNGEYCTDIEKKFGITAAQFNAWNTGVGSSCSSL